MCLACAKFITRGCRRSSRLRLEFIMIFRADIKESIEKTKNRLRAFGIDLKRFLSIINLKITVIVSLSPYKDALRGLFQRIHFSCAVTASKNRLSARLRERPKCECS